MFTELEKKAFDGFKNVVYNGQEHYLAKAIGDFLLQNQRTIAVAESCTGGLFTSMLTDISGSSKYVKGTVVSYTNEVKTDILSVKKETLAKYTAVSKEVAFEMAKGVRALLWTDYALSITGLAGPMGLADKPVGLVYVGIATPRQIMTQKFNFSGTRWEIKVSAVHMALFFLNDILRKEGS